MNADEIIATDHEYEADIIFEVEADASGWAIKKMDGWSIFVPNSECAVEPKAGETIMLFGRGIGYPVRGIIIAGRVYRYQTAEQYEEQRRADLRAEAQRKSEAAKNERGRRDARIAKLPQPLQDRMRRFARIKDNWCAEFEPYELFVCEEAAKIARLFPGDAERQAFCDADYERQKQMAPTLRMDEHSGNTFSAACHIANCLIHHPGLVAHAHGALCPLVGCQDYGCYAAYEGKVS